MASRARKIAIGCGVGCLALVALSIGACVSFTVWIRQPGELLQPERLVGPDTDGYVEWTLRIEDPGTEQFLDELFELQQRLEARNPGAGPTWLRGLIQSQRQRNRSESMRQMLPAVAAWSVQAGETPDRDLHLFTLCIESMGNRTRFLDLVMRYTLGLKHSVAYGDERIYTDGDSSAMFIRDNSFFLTSSEEHARLAIDRMRGPAGGSGGASAVETQLASVPDDAPLRGAIGNSRGELERVWKRLAAEDPGPAPDGFWTGVRGATVAGRFAGQTGIEATIELEGPDEAWATAHAASVEQLMRATYADAELAVAFAARPGGDRIRLSIRIEDVFAALDEL